MTKYCIRKPGVQSKLKNYHVFIADDEFTPCIANTTSLCNKASNSDTMSINEFECIDEGKVRHAGTKLERKLCGLCMSSMYGDED